MFNSQTNSCECSISRPAWDGVKCVACVKPKQWNAETKKCDKCVEGMVYNELAQECEECPKDEPIYQNGKCVNCPHGTNYESAEHVCVGCAEGTVWNITTEKCENLVKCPVYAELDSKGECMCPNEKPYNDSIECLACEAPQFWN